MWFREIITETDRGIKMGVVIFASIIIVVSVIAIVVATKTYKQDKPTKPTTLEMLRSASDSEQKRILGKMSYNERKRIQKEIDNNILNMIDTAFKSINWTVWEDCVHKADGQFDRMKRANFDKKMKILDYSEHNNSAVVRGSSRNQYSLDGLGCNCQDYKRRNLPCKHMYLVAMEHGSVKDKGL